MSYDVSLEDKNGIVLPFSENFEEGGTRCVGGTNLCELNITYNYFEIFGPLVRDLNGKSVRDTIWALQDFSDKFPNAKPYKDYWAPTPGNAKFAIDRLLSFARENPDGIWEIN